MTSRKQMKLFRADHPRIHLTHKQVDGVQWCIAHAGILDELRSDTVDSNGEPFCDMGDIGDPCQIVDLYYEVNDDE